VKKNLGEKSLLLLARYISNAAHKRWPLA